MPLYDFECAKCCRLEEHYAGMQDRVIACSCGGEMHRQISARYYVNPDIEIVTDNINGEMTRITSRRQLRQMCKEHRVDEKFGKGWV